MPQWRAVRRQLYHQEGKIICVKSLFLMCFSSRTSTEKYDKQSGVDLVYHRKSRFSSFSSPQMAGMNVRYSDYLELNQVIYYMATFILTTFF